MEPCIVPNCAAAAADDDDDDDDSARAHARVHRVREHHQHSWWILKYSYGSERSKALGNHSPK